MNAQNGDKIKQALNSEIEKIELESNYNEFKTYTIFEVLSLLYTIRDGEPNMS